MRFLCFRVMFVWFSFGDTLRTQSRLWIREVKLRIFMCVMVMVDDEWWVVHGGINEPAVACCDGGLSPPSPLPTFLVDFP